MKALTDILDLAIIRIQGGESIEAILAAYPAHAEQLRALLGAVASLDALPAVRFPSAQAMRADRNDFLLEVALLQVEPVSAGPLNRLKQWMVHLQSWQFPIPPIQRRERWKMSTVVVTMTLLVALLVGSVGGVTAMTSDLLPDSPLYGVKLFAEEATLIFTPDPERRAEQHLAMAQARLREIQQMAVAGEVPDDGTVTRLEQHLELALRYAQELDGEAERAFLVRTREMVTEQAQLMVGLEATTGEPVRVALRATERVLNRTGAEIDARLEGGPGEPVREQTGVGPAPEAPMTPSLVPSRFRNQGEGTTGDTCAECTPVGDEHKYGPQPDQPGPGQPGGNPDGTCDDCVPEGDEHKYGPQPDQPGPGQPGGNPDGTCDDCVPEGDEHKYGQQTEPSEPVEQEIEADGTCTDCVPEGDENHYGPQPDQPGPGESGGNPDGTCTDCVPEGDEHKYGQQSEPSEPVEQEMDADGTCTDCVPEGDENQYGPQPEQPGPGESGGNPDGTCTDCVPEGDEHKYGQQAEPSEPVEQEMDADETCTDCVPEGDENQYGPQPEQPGPGESGGNPDGTCTDCEPEGDQNQEQAADQPESQAPAVSGGGGQRP